MSRWPTVRLSELVQVPLTTGLSRAATTDARYHVLTLAAVRNGTLDLARTRPMDATEAEARANTVRTGAFYIVRGNGSLHMAGAGALAPPTVDGRVLYPDLLIQVVPDPAQLSPEFLSLAWQSPFVRAQVEARLRTSAGIHKINLANLGQVEVPLPPLDEQRRIAARLRDAFTHAHTVADKIDTRLVAIDLQRDAIVSEAFRGTTAAARPLGTIGRLTDGDWILTADYAPSGVRLLQVGDVGRGVLTPKSSRYITPQRAGELRCTLLEPGDVLISRMPDPLGRACLLPDLGYPAITAVDVTILRLNLKRADANFVVGFMNGRDWYAAVASKASGATRARISRRNLEALPVPVPPLDEQRRIATRLHQQLAETDRAKVALEAQRAAADALPAALLREVFGGAA